MTGTDSLGVFGQIGTATLADNKLSHILAKIQSVARRYSMKAACDPHVGQSQQDYRP